jgi:hypothetical protein
MRDSIVTDIDTQKYLMQGYLKEQNDNRGRKLSQTLLFLCDFCPDNSLSLKETCDSIRFWTVNFPSIKRMHLRILESGK